MRISDWSSDVCSSDLSSPDRIVLVQGRAGAGKSTMLQPVAKAEAIDATARLLGAEDAKSILLTADMRGDAQALAFQNKMVADLRTDTGMEARTVRSEEHTSELQSLMRISYAVFCLKHKTTKKPNNNRP